MGKLTARAVAAAKQPGRYSDGRGLMLVIGTDGSRKWVLRMQRDGRRRDFGLGPLHDVSLAEAREEADKLRQMGRAGLDPMASVSKGLPKQPRGQEHFAALPWQAVPGFINSLRETVKAGEIVRLAFEFLVLTAVRSGEMRGARWCEMDLDAATWTIPAGRM